MRLGRSNSIVGIVKVILQIILFYLMVLNVPILVIMECVYKYGKFYEPADNLEYLRMEIYMNL
jgi:heterodisulfide reductase subunit C